MPGQPFKTGTRCCATTINNARDRPTALVEIPNGPKSVRPWHEAATSVNAPEGEFRVSPRNSGTQAQEPHAHYLRRLLARLVPKGGPFAPPSTPSVDCDASHATPRQSQADWGAGLLPTQRALRVSGQPTARMPTRFPGRRHACRGFFCGRSFRDSSIEFTHVRRIALRS